MKPYRTLFVTAAVLILEPLMAKLPLPRSAFGRIEGALDFCAKELPDSASKFQGQKKLLAEGATPKDLSAARNSDEYKEGHAASMEDMSKQSREEAAKTCAAALEPRK
jgi:hypothetical protein